MFYVNAKEGYIWTHKDSETHHSFTMYSKTKNIEEVLQSNNKCARIKSLEEKEAVVSNKHLQLTVKFNYS